MHSREPISAIQTFLSIRVIVLAPAIIQLKETSPLFSTGAATGFTLVDCLIYQSADPATPDSRPKTKNDIIIIYIESVLKRHQA